MTDKTNALARKLKERPLKMSVQDGSMAVGGWPSISMGIVSLTTGSTEVNRV